MKELNLLQPGLLRFPLLTVQYNIPLAHFSDLFNQNQSCVYLSFEKIPQANLTWLHLLSPVLPRGAISTPCPSDGKNIYSHFFFLLQAKEESAQPRKAEATALYPISIIENSKIQKLPSVFQENLYTPRSQIVPEMSKRAV